MLRNGGLQRAACLAELLLCLVNNQIMLGDFIDSFCCYSTAVAAAAAAAVVVRPSSASPSWFKARSPPPLHMEITGSPRPRERTRASFARARGRSDGLHK